MAGGWETIPFGSVDGKGLFPITEPGTVTPSLASDSAGRLHAAWGSGGAVYYARCQASAPDDWPAKLRDPQSWVGVDGKRPKPVIEHAFLGDLSVTPGGDVWLAAVRATADGGTAICLAHHAKGWEIHELARGKGFHPPVLHVLPDGSVHLAWADTKGQVFYQRYSPGERSEAREVSGHTPRRTYADTGHHPVIASNGRQAVIAYETAHAQIEFAVGDGEKWRVAQPLTRPDPRFATDVVHSPHLALDPNGVIWLFFADATRKFTYFTRWLGTEWSDIYDARGIHHCAPHFEANLLSPDRLSVEKQPPAGTADLGVFLGNQLAADKREFHRLTVPRPVVRAGESVLFLDLLEMAGWEGIELALEAAQKHPKNPIFAPGEPGSFDRDRVFNHGAVLFEGDKFRMWYNGVALVPGKPWWEWLHTGYAESKDGITWTRVAVPSSPAGQGRDRNLVAELPYNPGVFKDPHDPDPRRRYKAVKFPPYGPLVALAARGEYDLGSPVIPGMLHCSGDGFHWTSEPITMEFPDGKPWEFVPQSVFYDPREPDARRRWKAYGWSTPIARRRAPSFAYSADCKKWIAYDRNPILDPTVSTVPMGPSGPQLQVHDTVVWPRGGYYLCLFEHQRDHDSLDIELAVSRDGEHFCHVKPGHKVIPQGGAGEWDSVMILPRVPVEVGDELRLYYGGLGQPPGAERPVGDERLRCCAGLASLRRDGFTHLRLKKGMTRGQVTTVPFTAKEDGPFRLTLNAACPPSTSLAVEVLDAASGQPLPGYAHGECTAFQGDAVRGVVRWRAKDRVDVPAGRRVALRFWLTGSGEGPRLYGFGFEPAR
jgi:hypothetical protein